MPRTKSSDPNTVKNQVIRLRVNGAEAEIFKQKAVEAGCRTISEYIRKMCIPINEETKKDSNKN